MSKKPRSPSPFAHHSHSLSVIVAGVVVMFLGLYSRADPKSHLGAFFGNAIADWLGVLAFIVATKYFYEVGSAESRTPPRQFHRRAARFLLSHSLTIVLAVTGLAWAVVYNRSDVDTRAGEVVGNIVSEWTQLLGLVLITKYARESGSKEGG